MKNLRQRMIEDMKLRGLTPGTQATYLAESYTQERHLPHTAAFVRHPSSGGRCPSAHHSIAAGPQEY